MSTSFAMSHPNGKTGVTNIKQTSTKSNDIRQVNIEQEQSNQVHLTRIPTKTLNGTIPDSIQNFSSSVSVGQNNKISNGDNEHATKVEAVVAEDRAQIQIQIEGMHCNSCVSNICGAIEDLPGTFDIQLTYEGKVATIVYNPKILKVADIIKEIEELGFKTVIINNHSVGNNQDRTTTTTKVISRNEQKKSDQDKTKKDGDNATCFLQVEGMTCASCVESINRNLLKVNGIHSVSVALLSQRAEVQYKPEQLQPAQIADLITNLGFTATVLDASTHGTEVLNLSIEGMTCASCVDKIESYMRKQTGIISADVALLTHRGQIKYDASLIGPRDIIKQINDLGFPTTLLTDDLKGDHLEKMQKRAIRQWRNAFFFSTIFGIPAIVIMLVFMFTWPDHMTAPQVGAGLSVENLVMFLLATPVQTISGRYFYVNAYKSLKRKSANMDVLIVLATSIAYLYSLLVVIVNMALKLPSPYTFFDVPPMLILFVSLGRWLEHMAKGKTSEALKKLLALQPPQGTLVKLDSNGKIIEERIILAQLIQRNDLLKVLPGETIPTDGRIVDGKTSCDESLLTGESMPVDKTVDDQVVGGTKNLSGAIIMRATHVGQETALKQIIKLVEDAQTSKAPIQQLADKIAGIFVPFIVILSLITLIIYIIIGYVRYDDIKKHSKYNYDGELRANQSEVIFELAFRYAIMVLSIACPCALGLATPTAVMVATGIGASNGILIKGGEPLELLRRIHTIVFDKTGTITRGKPNVVSKHIFIKDDKMTLDRMLAIAATAESGSEHPLGLAVRNHCKEYFKSDQLGHCRDFKAIWGFGLSASVTNIGCLVPSDNTSHAYNVLIGNREWMTRNELKVNDSIDQLMSTHENDGHTVILIGIDGKLVGMLAIADEIKPSAPLTIYALQSLGLRTILLTGDNIRTARAIAAQVGIKTVYAEVLPTQKERFIANLKEKMVSRKKVAMVGDGINDSPALARADVGIAVGTGTDIAIEAADIVLVRDELFDLVTAIKLSRKTVRRIRMNFLFAIVYNGIGIPISSGILLLANVQLMPWMASAAMALSSVSVVVSSLLLRRFKKPKKENFEKSSGFSQWLTTMSSNIEIHRGIENMNQNDHVKVVSNSYTNGIKITSSTVDTNVTIPKSGYGKENRVAPVRMNTIVLDPGKLPSKK